MHSEKGNNTYSWTRLSSLTRATLESLWPLQVQMTNQNFRELFMYANTFSPFISTLIVIIMDIIMECYNKQTYRSSRWSRGTTRTHRTLQMQTNRTEFNHLRGEKKHVTNEYNGLAVYSNYNH